MARRRPRSGTIAQVTTALEAVQRITQRAVEDELAVNEEGLVRLVKAFLYRLPVRLPVRTHPLLRRRHDEPGNLKVLTHRSTKLSKLQSFFPSQRLNEGNS
jgi:hypothetical protein